MATDILTASPAQQLPEFIEQLLAEIATLAQATESTLRRSPCPDELQEAEEHLTLLRGALSRAGWLADLALTKSGSLSRIHDGDASKWLLGEHAAAAA